MIYHYFVAYEHANGVGRTGYSTTKPIDSMEDIKHIENIIAITAHIKPEEVGITAWPTLMRTVAEEDEPDGAPFDE